MGVIVRFDCLYDNVTGTERKPLSYYSKMNLQGDQTTTHYFI